MDKFSKREECGNMLSCGKDWRHVCRLPKDHKGNCVCNVCAGTNVDKSVIFNSANIGVIEGLCLPFNLHPLYQKLLNLHLDVMRYTIDPSPVNLHKLKQAQVELFELAFTRPNPYSLVFKMAARMVYQTSKLAVWATAPTSPVEADTAAMLTAKHVQRLVKWTEWAHNIETCPNVYEPAEDSFLLADAALSEIKVMMTPPGIIKLPARILEVGCGTGIVSAILKTSTRADVEATDINPCAVECAKQNGVEAVQGDLFSSVQGKYDLILFNAPYLPDDIGEKENNEIDAALYGGPTGRETVMRFMKDVGVYLNEGGTILIVVCTYTGIDKVKNEIKAMGYEISECDSYEILKVLRIKR